MLPQSGITLASRGRFCVEAAVRTPGPAQPAEAASPAFDLVIFGGTGDLAHRKLLPALFHCFDDGQIAHGSRILAAASSELSTHAFRSRARESVQRSVA